MKISSDNILWSSNTALLVLFDASKDWVDISTVSDKIPALQIVLQAKDWSLKV